MVDAAGHCGGMAGYIALGKSTCNMAMQNLSLSVMMLMMMFVMHIVLTTVTALNLFPACVACCRAGLDDGLAEPPVVGTEPPAVCVVRVLSGGCK
jgi:hypothetical protein